MRFHHHTIYYRLSRYTIYNTAHLLYILHPYPYSCVRTYVYSHYGMYDMTIHYNYKGLHIPGFKLNYICTHTHTQTDTHIDSVVGFSNSSWCSVYYYRFELKLDWKYGSSILHIPMVEVPSRPAHQFCIEISYHRIRPCSLHMYGR